MNVTKKHAEKAALIMRSLGHPARIRILLYLAGSVDKNTPVTRIYQQVGLSQPETSRHLSVMRQGSILVNRKAGANSYYFINEKSPMVRCIVACLKTG